MPTYSFQTVDVFTDQRFGGNPLAVFTDARGMSDRDMQALAAEMNLSETSFVLPPADPANTARVRIFNRTAEMPFAGHPSIGTATVLAWCGMAAGDTLRLEVPAGIVAVQLERNEAGDVIGGEIAAPQPLSVGETFRPEEIAACAGLSAHAILTGAHDPVLASVGVSFVLAEAQPEMMASASPDLPAFRRVAAAHPEFGDRLSLLLYARLGGEAIHARMFAPLSGTVEDPATGSANATLAALLLSLSGGDQARYAVSQGDEMRRPSRLRVRAERSGAEVRGWVAGTCVPVLRGTASLD